MKVVKKVRLLTKDSKGLFVNNDNHQVLRNRAIVSDEVVVETENNYQDTGVLYIVDEEATKERDGANSNSQADDVIEFEGRIINEENVDLFISQNGIEIGKASTAKGKLSKVQKWIENKK